ncbi:GNAT family N-acetyltransferase [Kitasatospora sp. NPDC002227]|uniref:GNAT family N-acetyltransferase n=1 Tax=Kitasatospora sp. NPDC002227 TaxID=3154773 RepID=UPI00331D00F7
MRFFGASRRAPELAAERLCGPSHPGRFALGAWAADELVGEADYEVADGRPDTAELALAVADAWHHRGVATLLLEHLVHAARARPTRWWATRPSTGSSPASGCRCAITSSRARYGSGCHWRRATAATAPRSRSAGGPPTWRVWPRCCVPARSRRSPPHGAVCSPSSPPTSRWSAWWPPPTSSRPSVRKRRRPTSPRRSWPAT